MNAQSIRLTVFVIMFVIFSGCASGLDSQEVLTKAQVEKVIAQEKIERVSGFEQQPQDDGSVILLVTGNLRETDFGGCLSDHTDIEVRWMGQEPVVSSMSDSVQLSLSHCNTADRASFLFVNGSYDDQALAVAVRYLRMLLAGTLSSMSISGSQELKNALKKVAMNDVSSISVNDGSVEFQVLSRALAPRLLGVRFSIQGQRLKNITLNADNSIEVVHP